MIGAYFAYQKQKLRAFDKQQELLFGNSLDQKFAKGSKEMGRSCWDALECCAPAKAPL